MRQAAVLVLAMLIIACLPPQGSSQELRPTRRETILQWDDGVMDDPSDYFLGMWNDDVAVMYELPEWATCIEAVQAYVRCKYPIPTTGEFFVRVYAPDGPGGHVPGRHVGGSSEHSLSDTTWSWVTVTLPDPVGIGHSHFYGEQFAFVGFTWGTDSNLCLGKDVTPPSAGMSRYRSWANIWHDVDDAMVRAVVSDAYVCPVETTSWSRVKALFE
jgi:hypothetical protein